MVKKVLSFITDGKKFLALKNNPKNPKKYGGDFWFVVTGGVEKDESLEEAVKREIKEETNLKVIDIFDLKWGSIYKNWQGICEELNFIAFVNSRKVKLDNKEVVDFKWLDLENFVDLINWDDDKVLLKKVLIKSLQRKRYFDKLNVIKYN